MAQSFHTYTGDDVTQQFAFTKGYINTAHVSAVIDGVGTPFTWVNATLIDIGTPLLTGETLVVLRATPRAPLTLTDFTDGNSLPADDLDRVLLQAMYVAQETDDTALNSILLGSDDKYDAQSKIIKDIADGVDPQDAATRAQLDAAVVAAGNVPNPADPGDDGKSLIANAGTWAWGAASVVVANITNTVAFMKTFLLSPSSADALTNLGVIATRAQALGTASIEDAGVVDGNVPQMDATGYPVADGSQITDVIAASVGWADVTDKPLIGFTTVELIRKVSDETVNNSSVLQDDDDFVASVAANEDFKFELRFSYQGNTTADIKFTFTAPSGCSIRWNYPQGFGVSTVGAIATVDDIIVSGGGPVTPNGPGASVSRMHTLVGMVSNGATPGDLQFQWAQNTANASDTTVLADGHMTIWRE